MATVFLSLTEFMFKVALQVLKHAYTKVCSVLLKKQSYIQLCYKVEKHFLGYSEGTSLQYCKHAHCHPSKHIQFLSEVKESGCTSSLVPICNVTEDLCQLGRCLLACGKWDATVNQRISLKHEELCKQPTQATGATSSQLAERETCLNQPEAKQPTLISSSFVSKL